MDGIREGRNTSCVTPINEDPKVVSRRKLILELFYLLLFVSPRKICVYSHRN